MSGRLEGKVAIVTGAARGIGAAIAALFSEHGAQVVGLDRDPTDSSAGVRCIRADVTRPSEVEHAVSATRDEFGRVDVLVNNAGINVFAEPLELKESDWARCFDVDLKAAWNVTRVVLPSMLAQHSGAIVNIASVHAHKIIRGCFPYPVAKHGLIGMTRALGIEYAARGIRVNSISPGLILTPQVEAWLASQPDPQAERARQTDLLPCKRIGSAREVAYTALFLASDEAPFINAADIIIDGGRTQVYHD